MSAIDEYGPTVRSACRAPNPQGARIVSELQSILPGWCYAAALVIGLAVLFLAPSDTTKEVVQLERLAPRIERAQTLSPAAREAINGLMARQSILAGSGDHSTETRRKTAIDRVTTAMNAKEDRAATAR